MAQQLGKAAGRYARAIAAYLEDEGKIKTAVEELTTLADLMDEHKDLKHVMTSDVISMEDRRAIVDELVGKMKVSDGTRRSLIILSEAKRLNEIRGVAERLKLMLLERASVVPLEVLAANPLTTEQKTKVEQRFSKIFSRKVEATYSIDPALMGGLRVTAAGRTYDGTLAGWLTSLEEQLVEGSV